MRRQLFRLLAAMLAAVVVLVAGGVAASATITPNDPVRGAGCANGSIHHNWGNNSYPTYQYTLYVSWCWSTGGSSSRIMDIRGNGYSDSTTIFRDKNASGPQTSNHVNILPSDTFGNEVLIYGWFQSSDCVTGKLGVLCSSWTWHRSTVRLQYGGGLLYVGQT